MTVWNDFDEPLQHLETNMATQLMKVVAKRSSSQAMLSESGGKCGTVDEIDHLGNTTPNMDGTSVPKDCIASHGCIIIHVAHRVLRNSSEAGPPISAGSWKRTERIRQGPSFYRIWSGRVGIRSEKTTLWKDNEGRGHESKRRGCHHFCLICSIVRS